MTDSAEKDALPPGAWQHTCLTPSDKATCPGCRAQSAEKDAAWAETPLGYSLPPGRVLMCRGEASCDEPYRGEDGRRYYCRRTPGHPVSIDHDCPADAEARVTSPRKGDR